MKQIVGNEAEENEVQNGCGLMLVDVVLATSCWESIPLGCVQGFIGPASMPQKLRGQSRWSNVNNATIWAGPETSTNSE